MIFSCCLGTLSCGMWDLVPWPRVDPRPPALGAWSPSHWTTREAPPCFFWAWYKSGSINKGLVDQWKVKWVCVKHHYQGSVRFCGGGGRVLFLRGWRREGAIPQMLEWWWPTAFSEVLLPGLPSAQDCLPPKIMLCPWKQNLSNDWWIRE